MGIPAEGEIGGGKEGFRDEEEAAEFDEIDTKEGL